jgi:hypothetical protein
MSEKTKSVSTITGISQPGSADLKKVVSNEENNSHEAKDSNSPDLITKRQNNFFKLYEPVEKKVNESGTGYLCDNDDEYDDWVQNAQ